MCPTSGRRVPKEAYLVFITLEGIDGCGKSTQARLLAAALEGAGHTVVTVREPGGIDISEQIRAILLDPANSTMSDTCELLLYAAARAQVVHEVIAPALAAGSVVVCDRFFDSTTAYQGFAGSSTREDVDAANALAVGDFRPDLTFVFDIDPAAAAARRAERAGGPDRMEAKGLAFQERVAEGFRTIAREDPGRVRLVDATQPVDAVFACVLAELAHAGLAIDAASARAALLSVGA
ncbi:dTMP kinase [Collinsella tanakaei]|nr:dTMP kinase [Collinsella tanakaei]